MNAMVPLNHSVKGVKRETPFHYALKTADEAMTFLMLGLEVASPLPQLLSGRTAVASSMEDETDGRRNGQDLSIPTLNSFRYLKGERSPYKVFQPNFRQFYDWKGRGGGGGAVGEREVGASGNNYSRYNGATTITTNYLKRPMLTKAKNVSSDSMQNSNSVPDFEIKDENHRSVVHLAAMSRSPRILAAILDYKESESLLRTRDHRGNTPLHTVFSSIAAVGAGDKEEEDIIACLEMLLELGLDVNIQNVRGETPVFVAAKKKRCESLLHLLEFGADPSVATIEDWSPVHVACHSDAPTCLKYLFNTGKVYDQIKKETSEGCVPFYLATCSYSLECLKILLYNGDHLTNEDTEGKTRCTHLLENIPSASKFLEELFDESVTGCAKRPHEADFSITFDFSILCSKNKKDLQCSLISELTTTSLETLFEHPLIETFLFAKWKRINIFYYINFVVYSLFLILHTYYILQTFGPQASDWSNALVMLRVFRLFYIIVFLLILIPDLIIMVANYKKYMLQWETYFKLGTLATSAFTVFSSNVEKPTIMTAERHLAAISIFLAWAGFMMLIGRFTVFGIYVLMFAKVAKSIIKFVLAFSGLLIGFTIAFGIIFSKNIAFQSFPESIVKTLMMMVGEIDYTTLIEDNETSDMRFIGYVSLVTFLFLIPIIMANLLIGLAVSDIPELNRQGKIKMLSKQASYLQAYELITMFLKDRTCSPNCLRKLLSKIAKIQTQVTINPNKRWGRDTWRHNGFRKWMNSLPLDTIEAATDILVQRRNSSPLISTGGGGAGTGQLQEEEEADDSKLNSLADLTTAKQTKENNKLHSFSRRTHSNSSWKSANDTSSSSDEINPKLRKYIRDSYSVFEKEYKKEFYGLRQYITTMFMYNINSSSSGIQGVPHPSPTAIKKQRKNKNKLQLNCHKNKNKNNYNKKNINIRFESLTSQQEKADHQADKCSSVDTNTRVTNDTNSNISNDSKDTNTSITEPDFWTDTNTNTSDTNTNTSITDTNTSTNNTRDTNTSITDTNTSTNTTRDTNTSITDTNTSTNTTRDTNTYVASLEAKIKEQEEVISKLMQE